MPRLLFRRGLGALICVGALFLGACTHQPPASGGGLPANYFTISEKKKAAALQLVQHDLPFKVSIDPYGAVGDYVGDSVEGTELVNLRRKFLEPLAASPYASHIERVEIDAAGKEWTQWSCKIYLEYFNGPISLTHYGSFYDGKGNDDPDAYSGARTYCLREIAKLGKRFKWTH
jgi:hypothetical protein